jgi:hypothetical protein
LVSSQTTTTTAGAYLAGANSAIGAAINTGNVTLASGGWLSPAYGFSPGQSPMFYYTTDVGADIFVTIRWFVTGVGQVGRYVSACTVGGTAATLVTTQYDNNVSAGYPVGVTAVYRLAGGGTGLSQAVNVQMSNADYFSTTVGSYNNVGSVGAVVKYGSSTSPSTGPITCPTGGMTVAVIGYQGTSTSTSGGTLRNNAPGYHWILDSTTDTTFSGTTSASAVWSSVALQLGPKTLTVTIPAHRPGDIIVACSKAPDLNLMPYAPASGGTVPAWTLITGISTGYYGRSLAYFTVATSSNHTSGTWTNSVGIIVAVVRRGMSIGGSSATSTSTTAATTLTKSNGSSLLLNFHEWADYTATSTISAAPTGYTQRVNNRTSTVALCLNTKNISDSSPAVAQTFSGTMPTATSITVEVVALAN